MYFYFTQKFIITKSDTYTIFIIKMEKYQKLEQLGEGILGFSLFKGKHQESILIIY